MFNGKPFPSMQRLASLVALRGTRAVLILTVILSALAANQAIAQHDHSANEFEVFVAIEALAGPGQAHQKDDDAWFNVDAIFGLTRDRFRVFDEYFITPEEHDLERLQLGYEIVPDTVIWLGRYHQPASAWNTEHHHGGCLQTAITRPAIDNWEDEEGLIPQHITGRWSSRAGLLEPIMAFSSRQGSARHRRSPGMGMSRLLLSATTPASTACHRVPASPTCLTTPAPAALEFYGHTIKCS